MAKLAAVALSVSSVIPQPHSQAPRSHTCMHAHAHVVELTHPIA